MNVQASEPRSPEAARQTPYELAFAGSGFEESVFPGILEEATARGAATSSPEQFMLLASVGNTLRELMPDEPGTAVGDLLEEFGRLLFQAYQFWRYDRRLLLLSTEAARHLIDDTPSPGAWELMPPHPAGYLQLPRHLFWVQIVPGSPPEPLDGFFWTMIGEEDAAAPPYQRMDVLLAAGVRAGRPGFSTVSVTAWLDDSSPGHWAEAEARPAGRDFESVLPGGELQRLYSLTTTAEVLKLVSLCFWYVAAHPESLEPVAAAGQADPGGAAGAELPASALPYELIRQPPGPAASTSSPAAEHG